MTRQHSIVPHKANYFYRILEDDYLLIYELLAEKLDPIKEQEGKKLSGPSDCKAMIASVLENWMNSKRPSSKCEEDLYVYLTYDEWEIELRSRYGRSKIIHCLDEMEREGSYVDTEGKYGEPDTVYTGTIKKRHFVQNTFQYQLNLPVVIALLETLPEQSPFEQKSRPTLGRPRKNRLKENDIKINGLNIHDGSVKIDGQSVKVNDGSVKVNAPFYTHIEHIGKDSSHIQEESNGANIDTSTIASSLPFDALTLDDNETHSQLSHELDRTSLYETVEPLIALDAIGATSPEGEPHVYPHSHPSSSSSLSADLEAADHQGQGEALQASAEGVVVDESILPALPAASLSDLHNLHGSNGHHQMDSTRTTGSGDSPVVDSALEGTRDGRDTRSVPPRSIGTDSSTAEGYTASRQGGELDATSTDNGLDSPALGSNQRDRDVATLQADEVVVDALARVWQAVDEKGHELDNHHSPGDSGLLPGASSRGVGELPEETLTQQTPSLSLAVEPGQSGTSTLPVAPAQVVPTNDHGTPVSFDRSELPTSTSLTNSTVVQVGSLSTSSSPQREGATFSPQSAPIANRGANGTAVGAPVSVSPQTQEAPLSQQSGTDVQAREQEDVKPEKPKTPAPLVEPDMSGKWSNEKCVQYAEWCNDKRYTDKMREEQLKAAQAIHAKDKDLTLEQYKQAYDERNDEWWQEHKHNKLHVSDMKARGNSGIVRVYEMLQRIEDRATRSKSKANLRIVPKPEPVAPRMPPKMPSDEELRKMVY